MNWRSWNTGPEGWRAIPLPGITETVEDREERFWFCVDRIKYGDVKAFDFIEQEWDKAHRRLAEVAVTALFGMYRP